MSADRPVSPEGKACFDFETVASRTNLRWIDPPASLSNHPRADARHVLWRALLWRANHRLANHCCLAARANPHCRMAVALPPAELIVRSNTDDQAAREPPREESHRVAERRDWGLPNLAGHMSARWRQRRRSTGQRPLCLLCGLSSALSFRSLDTTAEGCRVVRSHEFWSTPSMARDGQYMGTMLSHTRTMPISDSTFGR